jgi:hypothetical protein
MIQVPTVRIIFVWPATTWFTQGQHSKAREIPQFSTHVFITFPPSITLLLETHHTSALSLLHATAMFRDDTHLSNCNRMNSADRSTIIGITTHGGRGGGRKGCQTIS